MATWRYVYLLPLSVFLGFVITFISTYVIAVSLGHVKASVPFISDSGTCPPESCIFSQLLNITALLLALTVYVRYSMVEDYYRGSRMRSRWDRLYNRASLLAGLVGSFGISVVGNFQVTNMVGVHMAGAMTAFSLGTLYCWLQVPITYRTRPDMTLTSLFWVRLTIALLCSLFFITGWSCALLTPPDFSAALAAAIQACNASVIPKDTWGRLDYGWEWRVCSTASEWAISVLFALGLLTFAFEFRLVTIVRPKVNCGVPKPSNPCENRMI